MQTKIKDKFYLHFFSSFKEFSEQEKALLIGLCEKFLPKIDAVLPLPPVDIAFCRKDNMVETDIIFAFTRDLGDLKYLMIDFSPNVYKKMKDEGRLEDAFLATLAHELNHTVRYPYYSEQTLIQGLIFEGCAIHFSLLFSKEDSRILTIKDMELKKSLWNKMKGDLNSKTYDRDLWFFSHDKENIPHWTGYNIGYDLVKHVIEKIGLSVVELTTKEISFFEKHLDTFYK